MGGLPFTSGTAQFGYLITLDGPVGVNVPIIVNGATATATSNPPTDLNNASYHINQGTNNIGPIVINQFFGGASLCASISTQGLDCASTGPFTLTASLMSGPLYYVHASATVVTGPNSSASIDPLITIDPAFPQADQFTLVSSPGVFTTATAVPEPTSALLVAAGLLAIIGPVRRRKPRLFAF